MIGYVTLGSNDIPRGTGGFHAGYFRDLDGHKLNRCCWKTG